MVEQQDPANSLTQQIKQLEKNEERESIAAHGSLEDQISALEAQIASEGPPAAEPSLEPKAVESPALPSGKGASLHKSTRFSTRVRPVSKEMESEFELESRDLELLESRVVELERYLGIEDMDLQYFYELDGEDLNKKS